MKKMLLNFCCIVTLCVTVWADGYFDILSQAEKWIDDTYQPGSIANRRAKRILEKIDEDQKTDVEKIHIYRLQWRRATLFLLPRLPHLFRCLYTPELKFIFRKVF